MRKWNMIGGATAWALVAIAMMSAALEPVELSAARAVATGPIMTLCAVAAANPVLGCETGHL
jgi:hypothetical protein